MEVKAKPTTKLKLSEAIRAGGQDADGNWIETDHNWLFFCGMKLYYPDENDTRIFEIKAVPHSVSPIGAALIAAHPDLETYCWDDPEHVEGLARTTFLILSSEVLPPVEMEQGKLSLLKTINLLNREYFWNNASIADYLEGIGL